MRDPCGSDLVVTEVEDTREESSCGIGSREGLCYRLRSRSGVSGSRVSDVIGLVSQDCG